MPVLPLVGSTIVPPGCNAPLASAASTIRTAMRSFTEPPGLRYSSLASTRGASGPRSRVTEVSRTSGVLPTRSTTDSAYCTVPPRCGLVRSPVPPPSHQTAAMSSSFPVRLTGMSAVEQQVTEGYAPVNGVEMYWRSQGEGGTPLVVVHGGFGVADMFGDLLERLAEGRRVIAVELQGHGHTRDVDREFSGEAFGDDLAALVDHLELGGADLMGYSLGAAACLRAAIQHPERVRRLVLVS